MTAEQKLMQIVENARGDDLERAEMEFAGMSERQLEEKLGCGYTRGELIEAYRRSRSEWKAARNLVRELVGQKGRLIPSAVDGG